jgi:uncharacterized protein YbaR (Trm112 family)
MVDKPARPATFNPATLAHLACPACYGDLRLEDSRLFCTACGRVYPVVDGIPVLIIERAERPDRDR